MQREIGAIELGERSVGKCLENSMSTFAAALVLLGAELNAAIYQPLADDKSEG